MEYQRFGDTIVAKLAIGEGIMASLIEIAEQENIQAAQVSGIGAVDEANLAFYKKEEKEYLSYQFNEEFEVLSILGNLTRNQGKYHPHIHIVLGRQNFTTIGGHLNEAYTSLTMEIIITVLDGSIERHQDEETGLELMDLNR